MTISQFNLLWGVVIVILFILRLSYATIHVIAWLIYELP